MSKQTSDGGSTSYYELPAGATELNDLIEYKNMSFAVGNILKAAYRLGEKEGAEEEYDLRKIIYFANRRLMQLGKEPHDREKLSEIEVAFGEEVMAKIYQRIDDSVEKKLSEQCNQNPMTSIRVGEGRDIKVKGDSFVDAIATQEFVIPSHREKFLRGMADLNKGGSDAF